jgi:polysaccharide biosynthesis/export protein
MNFLRKSAVTVIGALLVPALLAMPGCAGQGLIPAASVSQSSSVPRPDYRIGPGDQLRIFVWRNDELTSDVIVRPDGKISMPLVNDMQAEGKVPTALAADLEQVLASYIQSPQVNVIVQKFVGTFGDQIRVVGQAATPKAVSYRAHMTILDVMLEVGGMTEHASGNHSKVLRRVGDKKMQIRVRINDLLYLGDLSQNIEMLPGDVVVVPLALF